MHIIVVGCGRVGSLLAAELLHDGHSVAVIDKNESAFRRLPANWSGRAIVGFGFDREHLTQAGADKADALAAVTSGDNSNILTARIARETFHIPAVTARIYDPRRAEIYQRLGISTVATVAWTIEQVLRGLFPERTVTEWSDSTGQLHLVARALPTPWCGRALSDLEAQSGARVVAVTRGGIPMLGSAEMIGQEGDLVHLAVAVEREAELETALIDPRGGRR